MMLILSLPLDKPLVRVLCKRPLIGPSDYPSKL